MEFKELVAKSEARVRDFHEMVKLGLHCKHGDFMPAVHYPPIVKYPPISEDEMFRGYTPPEDGLMDVYYHIPFCPKRCVYCHYPSQYGASDCEKDRYIDAMAKEIDIYKARLGMDKIKLRVALAGGGTPTDLTPKQLDRFLKMFTSKCDMSHLKQFNYDVDPWTLVGPDGEERLRIMKDYGVDRLTIGIQSLNEHIIRRMNRAHDKKTALESIKNTLRHGYQLDIEFIFGYPEQSLEIWYEDLKEMVTLDSPEIQFYRLKVEAYGDQQGNIKKWEEIHPNDVPPVDDTMRMKQMAIDYLAEHGYHENLRRVFTRKKTDISLYAFNQCCLLYDQMSFGQTAFSSLRDRFVLNTQYFDEYYKKISEGKLPFNRGYVRDAEAQQRWCLILPLKNWFLRKCHYKKMTGVDLEATKYYPIIQRLKQYDLVEETPTAVKLTPKGAFFADEVVELFYDSRFTPFERRFYNDGPLNPYRVNAEMDGMVSL